MTWFPESSQGRKAIKRLSERTLFWLRGMLSGCQNKDVLFHLLEL